MTVQPQTRAERQPPTLPNPDLRTAGSGTSGPSPAGELLPPAERGHLILSAAVLEKIAGQLVTDAPGVGGARSGFMGFGGGQNFDTRPKVSVALSGRTAAITARIGLAYPTDIRTATEELRRLLISEIGRLTGVEVRQVDIHVDWLHPTDDQNTGRRLL